MARVLFSDIQEAVSRATGTPVKMITGRSRRKDIVKVRDLAVFLCRNMTPHSFPMIGRAFKRDHSTIISAVRRMDERIEKNAALASKVGALRFEIAREALTRQS